MFRLKWFLRIFFGVLIAISLRIGWKIGASTWANAQGQKELAQVFAETATTDPDWQFDSLSKSRKIPPPEKNSAQTLSRVASLIPSNLNPELPAVMEPYRNSKQVQVDCNRRPSDEAITLFRRDAARAKDAINLARNLKDLPEGNQVVSIASNWLNTKLEGAGQVRTVSLVLQLATIVSVADGDREAAADYLIALLNSSRSIGDEPVAVSQQVRSVVRVRTAKTLEWTLAQTELASDRLASLQAAWEADLEAPLLLYCARGERAGFDVLFRNIADGVVSRSDIAEKQMFSRIDFIDEFEWWLYRGRMAHERAVFHRWMTRFVELARLPVHEQPAAYASLPLLPDESTPLAHFLMPAVNKVARNFWRSAAVSETVLVALACERFRLRNGTWPESLDRIPKDILAAVPLDPYDGKPLRYRLLSDGVVVYSIGQDRTDDGGKVNQAGEDPGTDQGIRLWNPKDRGVAAEHSPAEK